jgi:hypothetical protein
MLTHRYVDCGCGCPECTIRFTWLKFEDECPDDMYVETLTHYWTPWYKRIWYALKYIFKKNHMTFNEAVLNPDQVENLKSIVDDFIAENKR